MVMADFFKRGSNFLKHEHFDKHSVPHLLRYLFLTGGEPAWACWILGVITIIGLALRMLNLNRPILYDEAFTFIHYASRSFKYMLAAYSTPNNHILHTLLVGIFYRLFGGHPWILRLPAFSAGVLGIPATYLTARRFFTVPQSLAASALFAVAAGFINYSTNGRGYTMTILLALLLANFGALLIEKQSQSALIAYGITGTLGFYTIPVFLYPMAGISLWVAVTYLTGLDPWQSRCRRLGIFLAVCAASGILTLLLYSPVFFFGTGLESIVKNEVVETLNWPEFVDGVGTRMANTWENWMRGRSSFEQDILFGGFLISLVLYRKVSRQKLPLPIFLVLAIAILLLVQRVVPFGRIFLYLEAFYLMFAAAGLMWLADVLFRKVTRQRSTDMILSGLVLLLLVGTFVNQWQETRNEEALADLDLQAEEYGAIYISEHIMPGDTIVATAPVDIQIAYYLALKGIPFERFYKRDNPVKIKNALVVLRKNAQYNTPNSVLDYYQLTPTMDMGEVEFLFEYGQVQIYYVPAR